MLGYRRPWARGGIRKLWFKLRDSSTSWRHFEFIASNYNSNCCAGTKLASPHESLPICEMMLNFSSEDIFLDVLIQSTDSCGSLASTWHSSNKVAFWQYWWCRETPFCHYGFVGCQEGIQQRNSFSGEVLAATLPVNRPRGTNSGMHLLLEMRISTEDIYVLFYPPGTFPRSMQTIAIPFHSLGFSPKSRAWPWSLSIKRMVHSTNSSSITLKQIGFNWYAIPTTFPCQFLIGTWVTERGKQGVRKKKNCYTGLFYLVKAS